MKTSIIIICYNWYGWLEGALESALAQTNDECEIIVMTDGSSEEVIKIAKQYQEEHYYRVRTLVLPDPSNNIQRMNQAVNFAKGDYYLFYCVDDFLKPYYVDLAEGILDNNPDIDIVVPDLVQFGDVVGVWKCHGLVDGIKNGNTMFFSSVVRKSLWQKLGGYDENIPHAVLEDWDFWVRAYYAKAQAFHIPAPLYEYRIHPKQYSKTTAPQFGAEIGNYLQNKWSSYG